jgi:murein tripeptide amidase MpaA
LTPTMPLAHNAATQMRWFQLANTKTRLVMPTALATSLLVNMPASATGAPPSGVESSENRRPQSTILKTRAELSDYQQTSRYAEVLAFCEQLQQSSPLLRLQTFGRSNEGRDLPPLILSEPAVSSPAEARASGKTIVLVLANIHAGEVEGKEASLAIARQLVQEAGPARRAGHPNSEQPSVEGMLRPLLSKLVVLVAPIYNADGNERV